MPTISERLSFNYDGIDSGTYNIVHISTDSGMFQDKFGGGIDINETKVRGNDKPYFNSIDLSPIQFDLHLAFDGDFNDQQIDDIIRWLFTDYYKPLYFEGQEDKIFYCMPFGEPIIVHNGLKQGYITLQMRCNSAYIYSPIYLSENYDLSNGISKTINIINKGHKTLYPEISIEKIGIGTVTFTQLTDNSSIFEIRDLTNAENIYINCEKEIIQSDIIGVYRYDKVFGKFLKLFYGNNSIKIDGACKVQFRYQYKFKF